MAAFYHSLEFRTNLEARWAAFFDLAGWTWRYNPAAVDDWKPDFHVTFPCGHSECNSTHSLLVSVLPVTELRAVLGHPALAYAYGAGPKSAHARIGADAGALFGASPRATSWEMSHGAGGGACDVTQWVHDSARLWIAAADHVSSTSIRR